VATKLIIPRGTTFRRGAIWLAAEDEIDMVDGVTLGFPTIISCPGHSIMHNPIPVALMDLGQLSTLDADGNPSFALQDRILATAIGDTISVQIDSTSFAPYTSGGYVVLRPPKDLTGYSARMQFRESADDDLPQLEILLGTGITLGGMEGTIDYVLTEAQTEPPDDVAPGEGIVADSGVWNIELIAPGPNGDITRFAEGTFQMTVDVNRPWQAPT